MCGKFSALTSWRTTVRYADAIVGLRDAELSGASRANAARYTPMQMIPVVTLDPGGHRVVVPMRWGWIDDAAPDPMKKPGLLHARGETADIKPTWKQAFSSNRGAIFVETFNVGEDIAPGKVKQWTCRRTDGAPLALAVIFERWVHPQHGMLHVFVPVTTSSPAIVHTKDDRFPVLMDSDEEIALWLGETGAPLAEIKTQVRTYAGELIVDEEAKPEPSKPPKAAKAKDDAQPSLF